MRSTTSGWSTTTPSWPRTYLAPLVETLEDDAQIGAASPKMLFESTFVDVEVRSRRRLLPGEATRDRWVCASPV